MIRLVLVELTRLRWRRAVGLLVAAAIIIPLVILAVRAYDTRPVNDDDLAEAQAVADEQREFLQEDIERCEERPSDYGINPENAATACERRLTYEIRAEDFLYRQKLDVAEERGTSAVAVVAIVAVLMLLAGTTYVGHDWNSGSMSNQLLFEPRRLRVWVAKAVAVSILACVVAVVGLALFWGGLLAVAQSRDLDPSGQVLEDIGQHALRSLTMIVGAAFFGYALTTLSRSTVFTIGVLFAVSVAGGLLFALLPQGALAYEPATNALAVVNGRAEYYVDVPDSCFSSGRPPRTEECDDTKEISVQHGTIYYGVLLLAVGAVSAASYRRRDVP